MSKVLIVDDSNFQRICIKKLLSEYSFEVLESENGEEALNILKSETPEFIIVDLLMPIMGGIELIEKINELHPGLKIMVITSDIQSAIQEKCKILGVSSFINKPILKEKFKKEIEIITSNIKITA